jgi:hypothetical protein
VPWAHLLDRPIHGFVDLGAVPLDRSLEDALEKGQTTRRYLQRGGLRTVFGVIFLPTFSLPGLPLQRYFLRVFPR